MTKIVNCPGTLQQRGKDAFVTNKQFASIFKHLQEKGYVQDSTTNEIVYLTSGDIVEVIRNPNTPRRRLLLRTLDRKVLSIVQVGDIVMTCVPVEIEDAVVLNTFFWEALQVRGQDFSKLLQADVRENQAVHCVRLAGDRGDTYDAVYKDMDTYMTVRNYMDGRFLKAAYSVIDKQGMVHPGDKVDILITEVGGENLITFVLQDGSTSHYRIGENSIRCTPVITVLEFKTTETTHMFSVVMTTPFNSSSQDTQATLGGNVLDTREQYKPQDASHSWIPQINQFVKVVGRTEMWMIHDYDDYTNEFIIKLADRTRAKRAETLVRRGGDGEVEVCTDMSVKGSCLRPVVLKY